MTNKKIPAFNCKKCGHLLFLESGKLEKLVNCDCPFCGEESDNLWIFKRCYTKKQMDLILILIK